MMDITTLTLIAAGFQCAPEPLLVHYLTFNAREYIVASETSDGGDWRLEKWENVKDKTWTVTATDANGMSCLMASGTFERA